MRYELTSLELRKSIRTKYCFPGGYELYGVTRDGGVLCCDCMRKEYKQVAWERRHHLNCGWHVEAVGYITPDDVHLHCDHCNKDMGVGED